jgi:long-subunit fatty acid transport protein
MQRKLIRIYIGLLLTFFSIQVGAQNESDVVRYIDVDPFGTARYASMAGAFGSLGGDLTTLILNPAGSAIYHNKELGLTLGYAFNNVISTADDYDERDNKNYLVFNSAGFLGASATEKNKNLYFNYGLAYNKTADFNRNSSINYVNNQNSMLFSFVERADGSYVEDLSEDDPFVSYLAYEAYLIDEDLDDPKKYRTQTGYEESFNGVKQANTIEEEGSMGEISGNFSVGINDKVFVGITLSITSGSYEVNSNFIETTTVDTLLLDNFTFNYKQKSDILGFNTGLGIIIKPEKWLRLGLAWHIPYEITIRDDFNTYLNSKWKDGDVFNLESPDGFIEYKIKNPGKWIVSAAVVSGFQGLISIDVEWMNLAKAQISSDDFDFSDENNSISQSLRNTLSVKIGGEIWFGKFNLRAGYAYRQNPYVFVPKNEKKFYNTFSGGAGLLTKKGFFINLSLAYKEDGNSYYPYGNDFAPLINEKYNNLELLAGIGIKFK